jgi:sugar-specific transcriptional regulator TrmB
MKEILRNIGFDDKETDIYLALLKIEKASVSELLKHTQIERRTIYDVLERLIQKGRVSFFEENGTRKYTAVQPAVLLEDLEQKQKEFKNIIPQLEHMNASTDEIKLEVLKGLQGLRTIFLEIVNQNEEHLAFGDIKPLIVEERYSKPVKKFLQIVESKNLKEKIIYEKGDPITKIKGGEYRAVEKSLVFPTPTIIYGDVVTQYIFTEPLTIIKITSKEVANTHRQYFEHFWKMAKK